MSKRRWVWSVAILVCAVAGWALSQVPAKDPASVSGQKAPDFTLRNLKGETVKLGDMKGKVVLLCFSATWCPHCRTAIPGLKDIYTRYKDKEFMLLAIFIQESTKKVSAYAKKNGITYPVLLDEDGKVANAYGVRGIPSRMIIGKEGEMLCRDCRTVEPMLEKLLHGAT